MGVPGSILVAVVLNVVDLMTGTVAAVKAHRVMSSKLRDGIFKKVGFLICYFLGWLMDNYGYEIGFHFDVPVLGLIILYVCTVEITSIIENVAKLNPKIIPASILKYFNISDSQDEKKGKK